MNCNEYRRQNRQPGDSDRLLGDSYQSSIPSLFDATMFAPVSGDQP